MFPLDSLDALGSILRQTREARGLTISEVSHDTFIRTQYLEALEAGDLSRLPEPVYILGFLRRYANYLGLEGERVLRQATPLFGPVAATRTPISQPNRKPVSVALRPVHLWTAYVVLIMLAVGGLSAFLEGGSNPFTRWLPSRATSSEPNRGGQNNPASEQPIFPTLEEWITIGGVYPPSADNTAPQSPHKPVQLDIRVVDRPSWLRVIADGRTVFEDTLQPGAQQNWSAEESIVLRAGNAGGILLTFNNRDLGVMGSFGEVKEQVFQRPQSSSGNSVQ
jgi:cytoskeletal protein RodZ